MGTVQIEYNDTTYTYTLQSSTRIGRHWSNTIHIHTEDMPLYWLELRWRNNCWAWRTLNAESETRGMGAMLQHEWRSLQHNQTIRLDGTTLLRCTDDTGPTIMIEALEQRRYLSTDEMMSVVECLDGKVYKLGELDTDRPLADGEIFKMGNHLFRANIPAPIPETKHHLLFVGDTELWLEVNLIQQRATFGNNAQEVHIDGNSVLLIYVYAKAILDGDEWLSAEMAFEEWVKVGGNPKSSKSRISWERGKLRNKLAKLSVGGSNKLFESQTIEGIFEFKLNLTKKQISIH